MTTRRSAIKSIAATLLAPTIKLRQSIPDERLLAAFCDPEPWRYDFTKPFGVGSLTYASDSFALIRCELRNRSEDGERRLPKNVIDVFDDRWNPNAMWRDLTPDDLKPTEKYNGYALCPECGNHRVWFGEHYPDDQEHADALPDWDVDDNTIRDVSCKVCHGREYQGLSCVMIDGVLHKSWTLRRILALPNPQVCGFKNDKFGTVMFRADGFHGISLGVCRE